MYHLAIKSLLNPSAALNIQSVQSWAFFCICRGEFGTFLPRTPTMNRKKKGLTEPTEVLYRVKRGLSAYVSYLAACEMKESFSEYILYEPLLRIMTTRGYRVTCEVPCPGMQHASTGDRKRLDFVAQRGSLRLAIEVKWAKSKKPDVRRDQEKLEAFLATHPSSHPLLCVFGSKSVLEPLDLPEGKFRERGKAVYADLRKTKYGCRIFQLKPA